MRLVTVRTRSSGAPAVVGHTRHAWRALLGVILLAGAAACGSDDDEPAPTGSVPPASTTTVSDSTTTVAGSTTTAAESTTTVETTTTAAAATTVAPATTAAPATTVSQTTTSTEPPPPASTLPGDPFDPFFAPVGAELDVIGIAFDRMLNLHALPGADQPVVGALDPLATGIVSQGRGRLLPAGAGIWLEVTAAGTTGWVDSRNLAYLGGSFDQTATVGAALGLTPSAPSMLELGVIVTDVLVPSDPEAPPGDIVVVAAPAAGPTSELVLDTFPGEFFGSDDSIGTRYVVVGQQLAEGDPYALVRVEALALCTRGATAEGFCI